MPAWLGPAISAGANIIGGLLGGSGKGDLHDQWRHEKNMIDYQRGIQIEFARNGIKWKAQDAREAGIHPLYALGAPTTSFSPISVGGSSVGGGSGLGAGIAAAGADLGRAISATGTASERMVRERAQQLELRRLELGNELLESQVNGSRIANLRQAGGNPALPMPGQKYLVDGQGATALYQPQAMQPTASDPVSAHSEPGPITSVGFARTPTGWEAVPSNDIKNRIEDNALYEWEHFIRNKIAPIVGGGTPPPNVRLKPGQEWYYHPFKLEWQRRDRRHGASGSW